MKILIAGAGKVGKTLSELLCDEGYDVTVIDEDREVLDSCVTAYDVMAVHGNCAAMETLSRAGIGEADLLIAATGTDEVNLLCCVTARGMNPAVHTISRVRNPEYIEQAHRMPGALSLSMTFSPEKQAAEEIARLIRYPGFLQRDTFAKGRNELVEFRIEEGSPLAGCPLSGLSDVIHTKVLVCAVLRDGRATIPDGAFTLRAADRIFVTAPEASLSRMLKSLGLMPHKAKSALLIGGGRISYYLAERLEKAGLKVKIIEKDKARCIALAEQLSRTDIICGDVSYKSTLESEGLGTADALVNLTDVDELNMIVALYGKTHGTSQIITKLTKVDDSKIIDSLPVGSVICPRKLVATNVLRYARALHQKTGAAITVHLIADEQAEAVEFLVTEDTPHIGEELRSFKLRPNLLIAGITHEGVTVIPDGHAVFQPGDSLVVVTTGEEPLLTPADIFA